MIPEKIQYYGKSDWHCTKLTDIGKKRIFCTSTKLEQRNTKPPGKKAQELHQTLIGTEPHCLCESTQQQNACMESFRALNATVPSLDDLSKCFSSSNGKQSWPGAVTHILCMTSAHVVTKTTNDDHPHYDCVAEQWHTCCYLHKQHLYTEFWALEHPTVYVSVLILLSYINLHSALTESNLAPRWEIVTPGDRRRQGFRDLFLV